MSDGKSHSFGYGIMENFKVNIPSWHWLAEEWAEVLKSWMVCALLPALRWQRLQVHGWQRRLAVAVPPPWWGLKLPRRLTLPVPGDVLQRHSLRRRGRRRGWGGGRVGRVRASPALVPSLSLASHVNLERLISSLLQHCKRGALVNLRTPRLWLVWRSWKWQPQASWCGKILVWELAWTNAALLGGGKKGSLLYRN